MNNKVIKLTRAAMTAALYVVLTLLANAFGLASNAIQIRFSEALCILPFYSVSTIPGLFLGCLLSNFITGCCVLDIICGSIATLIGAFGAYLFRKWKWCVPVPTILANAIIVPFVLSSPYGYGIQGSFWYFFATVGIGEVISCGILGMILLFALRRIAGRIF